MSQNLFLVKYQMDEKGNPYEDKCEIIESAFITPELVNLIEKEKLLEDKRLLEEIETVEFSNITCIENYSLNKALEILQDEFIQLILKTSDKLKSVVFNSDEISSSMDEYRTITNLQHIIKLKKDKFEHSPNVVLKLG